MTQIANQSIVGALLDIKKVPDVVGDKPKEQLREILRLLNLTTFPILLVGDSGTGKSQLMKSAVKYWTIQETERRKKRLFEKVGKKAASQYSDAILSEYGLTINGDDLFVPGYYVQLSRDETKTSLFLGNRMIEGTYKTVKGLMAIVAEQHAIVAIDEIGHATHSILTLFNAFDGKESIIAVGDQLIDASGMKIIYGANHSSHAGNVKLPQSFVNRVLSMNFDYPGMQDEFEISKSVAERNYLGALTLHDSVGKYLLAFIREIRKPGTYPLSARNVARGIVLCQIALALYEKSDNKKLIDERHIDDYFLHGNNLEALRRLITKRILGREAIDTATLQSNEITQFLVAVSKIGVDRFKEIMLQMINFHVDSEGLELFDDTKNQILGSLI